MLLVPALASTPVKALGPEIEESGRDKCIYLRGRATYNCATARAWQLLQAGCVQIYIPRVSSFICVLCLPVDETPVTKLLMLTVTECADNDVLCNCEDVKAELQGSRQP